MRNIDKHNRPQGSLLLFQELRELHESPQIPNFKQNRRGIKLQAGMTLAIEPMINIGRPEVDWLDDDWTVVTEDGSLSAHYENTVLITDGEPVILTLPEM